MNTDDVSEHENCKIAQDQAALDELNNNEKQKSQLFFSKIEYVQRGKYICMATQEFKGQQEKVEHPVSFLIFISILEILII